MQPSCGSQEQMDDEPALTEGLLPSRGPRATINNRVFFGAGLKFSLNVFEVMQQYSRETAGSGVALCFSIRLGLVQSALYY